MDPILLPAVNASLNALAAVLLVRGRRLIRRGEERAHRRTMVAAFAVSSLFLLLYVVHKVSRGFVNTPYEGIAALRGVYYAILLSHVPLAMTVPVFALRLLWLGTHGERAKHRRLARIAWPIWLYVSATGVAIFALLYAPALSRP